MTLPRKWLPQPVLSLALLITWLLLFNSIAPGHILLGALLGILIPQVTVIFWPQRPRLRRPGLLLKYVLVVLWDILIANVVVARIILDPTRPPRPDFVHLPLDLQDTLAITILANTISLTPGTVTSDVSSDYKSLLLHCLDVDDEAALVAHIKNRYEAPLKEIFE